MPTKAERKGLLPFKGMTRTERQAMTTVVDLDHLDVHVLVNELIKKYNQHNDVGVVRSWFRRNRVKAQEKHLEAVLSKIRHVRQHSNDLAEFKATLMTQRQVLENLITGKIEESQFMVKQQREEQATLLEQQKVERERMWLELDRIKNENDKLKYEAEKAKWEAEESKQRAWIIELRGKLINKIINEVQFADINMKQVFVLIEMIKDSSTDSDILGAEARWDQLKAEAKRTMAQAEQEETKADWEKYKFQQDSKEPDE